MIKPLGAAAAKSLQSCPTLWDSIDGSPPGSPVPEIFQARTLEWVAISFSNAWKWKVTVKSLSRVQLLATPWTAAHQAPPSMGLSRQEYWSGVPLPSPSFDATYNARSTPGYTFQASPCYTSEEAKHKAVMWLAQAYTARKLTRLFQALAARLLSQCP